MTDSFEYGYPEPITSSKLPSRLNTLHEVDPGLQAGSSMSIFAHTGQSGYRLYSPGGQRKST